jgi:hypothetical protein
MTEALDRDALLTDLDRARMEFEEALRRAPDAALRFKPSGEDYALGGLVVHVADVMQRYTRLLEVLRHPPAEPFTAPESPTSPSDAELIREGFGAGMRVSVLDHMRATHDALVQAVPESGFDSRKAVLFGASTEPYPTAPADVIGWVLDHYREHTRQIGELVTTWADTTR